MFGIWMMETFEKLLTSNLVAPREKQQQQEETIGRKTNGERQLGKGGIIKEPKNTYDKCNN
jgi:hypothetical protein